MQEPDDLPPPDEPDPDEPEPEEPHSPTEALLPDDAGAEDVIGVTSPLWRP
jgi:hypothetical protein